MVEVRQAEVWWAELPEPVGSGPGLRRPVVVVQGNPLNRSRIATVVYVPLTSNLVWADAPGNALIPAKTAGLPKDSVANASQIIALDRTFLTDRAGRLPPKVMRARNRQGRASPKSCLGDRDKPPPWQHGDAHDEPGNRRQNPVG